jgi:hypothetical protein
VEQKAYTRGQIIIGTFIGGPFAAMYFLKKNFDLQGDKESSKKTIIVGLSIVAILLAAVPVLPESIPSFVYGVAYTAIAQAVYEQKQKSLKDTPRYSHWNVAGVTVLSIVMFLILAIPLILIYSNMGLI